ncbi:hypothetical protein [Paenibacillus sp. MMS18-CY102]|uniref:hypothetical protein n=1 Tax=Paenibacillus sp. MMS18-CY102 TaxID=2682849 RepID=UPI0013665996|nr:hypothetical protein [Paenibacillus sp. MMS18-CY102]MWC26631.1 hypothetical protein [Paenibacillus sp. MMS18-CY102]
MNRDADLRMIGWYVVRGHDHERMTNLSPLEFEAYHIWMEQHHEAEAAQMKRIFGGK